MFISLQKELTKLESEVDGKKLKDRLSKIKEVSDGFIQQQEEAFMILARTNKNLFDVVERIAEKEMTRDPVNFIRTESIMGHGNVFK